MGRGWSVHLPLDAVGCAFDVPRPEWIEDLDYVGTDRAIPFDQVAPASAALVWLSAACGQSLTGYVGCLNRLLALKPGLTGDDVERFVHSVASVPGITLQEQRARLFLRIDKNKLLAERLGSLDLEHIRVVMFFFKENLLTLLHRATQDLEDPRRRGVLAAREIYAWPRDPSAERTEKLVIVAPEWTDPSTRPCVLDGPYLAVIGGDPLLAWERIDPPVKSAPKWLEDLPRKGPRNLAWEKTWATHLTPFHLKVEGRVPAAEPVLQAIHRHAANLCLLFTADGTYSESSGAQRGVAGERVVSAYRSHLGQAEVEWVAPTGVPTVAPVSAASLAALLEIVAFLWGSEIVADRRGLVRDTVVRALEGTPRETTFSVFTTRAEWIWAEIQFQWSLLTSERVKEVGTEVQALEDYLGETVQTFAEQTSSMIKGLSDTMLGAVAVLLGSFVASLFQQDSDPIILRTGAFLYAVYLLIFPLLFNMTERGLSFYDLVGRFEARRTRFQNRLRPARVDEIVGHHVERAQSMFWVWFALTLAAYLVVAGGLAWLSLWPAAPGFAGELLRQFRHGLWGAIEGSP